MCGFAGYFDFFESRFASCFRELKDPLHHRGPDYHGYYISEHQLCGLYHARLSILDLSANAHQPFFSHDKRYVIAYNGEVYNFKSLAEQLDIKRKTGSDTEVLVEAFAKKGPDFVTLLNGMFCMAIYDTISETLYLFRDRIGIKPLYVYRDQQGIIFGSELKAISSILKKLNLLQLDKTAIANFLHLGYIPEHQSVYQRIAKFPAGSYACITKGTIQENVFWQAERFISSEAISDRSKAKKLLKDQIVAAVNDRLVSDVPLGTFLSGGIDSSLVSAIAQKNTTGKLQTFTIGFEEEQFDEAVYAKKIAKHIGSDHHEKMLSYREAQEKVALLCDIYDEPFADSSAIPTLLVSEYARQNVKVILSGDGGDELFMGYGMYNWAQRLNHPLLKRFRLPIAKILKHTPSVSFQRAGWVFNLPDWQRWNEHIFSQEQYLFNADEVNQLLMNNAFPGNIYHPPKAVRNLSPQEIQSLFDLQHYLKDDLLTKVDRASMFHSLEVRVPLLDHRIVELAININDDLKLLGKERKIILKDVLYDYFPADLFNRPKKGFAIPLNIWLSKDLKYLIDKFLSRSVVEQYGLCNYSYIENLISQYLGGKTILYNKVWALTILHQWLCKNMP